MKKTNILGLLLVVVIGMASVGTSFTYPCGWGGGYRGAWGGCYRGGWGGYYGGYYGGYWPAVAAGVVASAITYPYYSYPVTYAAPVYTQVAAPVVQEVKEVKVVHQGDPTLAQAQAKLAGLGYYKGGIDGVFGMQTQAAIFEFQAGNGLAVTGRLDLKTQAALGLSH